MLLGVDGVARLAIAVAGVGVCDVAVRLLYSGCGYLIVPYTSNSEDYNILANVSYITGSHTMKFGLTNLWGENWRAFDPAP